MPTPTLDGTGVLNETGSAVTSFTFSSNKSTAGTNRYGIVMALGNYFGTTGHATATWNGVSMDLLAENFDGNQYAAVWAILSPPTSASAVTVSFSGGDSLYGTFLCYCFQDVDQSTPHGTIVTGGSGSASASSLIVSSAVGETVIDAITEYNETISANVGQTEIAQNLVGFHHGGSSYAPGAASVNMRWTFGNSGCVYVAVGIPLKPSGAGAMPFITTIGAMFAGPRR